jgi:MFS family permease
MHEVAPAKTPPAPPPAPRSFAALRQPRFRAFFVGSALAMAADNIEHVISYWIMFRKFHSPLLGGIAVVTHWVPFLLFAFFAGALADRFDPRRLIQVAMGLFMAVSLAWGLIFLWDAAEVWHAVVLLTVHGLAGVLWQPAAQLLIHDLVGSQHLQSAVRLNATGRYLGLLVGPGLGAALMLTFGTSWGLIVNAAIYLPFLLWVTFARIPRPAARPGQGQRYTEIARTLKAVSGDRTLVLMILLAGAASFFIGGAYHAQMPGFAADLGQDRADFRYSMLLAADAAGALLAGMVLEGRNLLPPRTRTAIVLASVWCVALGLFALSGNLFLAIALLFIAGFVELSFSAMAQTLVQLNAPAEIRGRVIGLFTMSALGMRTFSGITVGFAGSLIGIHWSLAASAGVLLVVCLTLLAAAMRPARPFPSSSS